VSVSHILVPVGFTDRCIGAADFAAHLAVRFKAKITLFRVELPEGDPIWIAEHVSRAEKQLAGFLGHSSNGTTVQRIVRVDSDVADAVVRLAADIGANLIASPTHGYGGLRRRLVGSVTAQLLRDASCPVWTSAHLGSAPAAEWLDPKDIVCAVDRHPESITVLRWASQMAADLGARLHIARAVRVHATHGSAEDSWELNLRVIPDARADLEQFLYERGIHGEVLVEPGSILDLLPPAVERLRAGLLVIGKGSWRAAGELGSHTYQIIREVPCPVVSV